MDYNFSEIEKKWQAEWAKAGTYKVSNQSDKKPFYVLDMFPYPSGAGLHVGHPLGYIASDIYSRYKRLQGFNVLHPMGFDSYGLPAEQYAIQTGQHPEKTTMENIAHYIEQLQKIGFNYDWDREVKTCNPDFYKWTQWAFIQMFNSYFDTSLQKAQPISKLIEKFEQTDPTWATLSEKEQQERLMNYRIAYLADTKVNWCPQLGCVLANDEVSEGLSVRGGYPVEQRVMRQWNLRVSAYAPRLLQGLDTVDWTDSLKETQRNWIGRSEGTEMEFYVKDSEISFKKSTDAIRKNFDILVQDKTYKDYEFLKVLRNTKDGASGKGLTTEISKALETAYQRLKYELELTLTGGSRKGFLKSQKHLDEKSLKALKKAWEEYYSGNANTVVLNDGITFQEASNSSQQNEMDSKTRTFADEVREIFHLHANYDDFVKKRRTCYLQKCSCKT